MRPDNGPNPFTMRGRGATPPCRPISATEFDRRIKGEVPRERLQAAVHKVKERLAAEPKNIATRAASGLALETLVPNFPELVGGSADLTGSNNTKVKGMPVLTGRFPAAATSTTASANTPWSGR